jgi:hypothetical protein
MDVILFVVLIVNVIGQLKVLVDAGMIELPLDF